jgi:hypothetical protein
VLIATISYTKHLVQCTTTCPKQKYKCESSEMRVDGRSFFGKRVKKLGLRELTCKGSGVRCDYRTRPNHSLASDRPARYCPVADPDACSFRPDNQPGLAKSLRRPSGIRLLRGRNFPQHLCKARLCETLHLRVQNAFQARNQHIMCHGA